MDLRFDVFVVPIGLVSVALGGKKEQCLSFPVRRVTVNTLRTFFLTIALSALPVSGVAQDWSLASEKDRLDYEETRQLLIGNTLRFPGVGQSTYHANGAYTFTREADNITTFGSFEVRRDGRVCVDMQQQLSDCSTFIKRNGIVFLLTPEGRRFEVSLELKAN